jgi:drug/metabolite transporter (DMT)-like permease
VTAAVLLALLTSVLYGVGDFIGGVVSRRVALTTVLLVSQAVAVVLLVPSAVPVMGSATGATLAWGALAGVGVAVGMAGLFKGLAIGTMGVVAPISSMSVAVPVVAGLLAGERFGTLIAVGLAIAVAGAVMASGPERGTARPGAEALKPVLLAIVAAAGFGLGQLSIARGSAGGVTATVFTASVVTLVIYVVAVVVRRVPVRVRGWYLVGLVALGVAGTGANLAFGTASRLSALSLVAVLAALYPAITAVLGWWLLGERLRVLQRVGVVAVLTGVALIAGGS